MSGNLSTIRRFSWIVYAAVILSLLLPSAFAQTTISTGSIQGTITDQSGALVNGAKVIITNKAAGQTITLTTSSSGTYTSGSLLPGNYVVRVEAKGFQTSELPVTVQVGTASQRSPSVGAPAARHELRWTAVISPTRRWAPPPRTFRKTRSKNFKSASQ